MKSILIIVAHPDDEVLGCGGTMAKLAIEGCGVNILVLGEGVTSRDEKRDRAKKRGELSKLKKELENAGKILSVKAIHTCGFPDNRFDTVPLLEIVKSIEKVKMDVKPNVIFTHHHGDLNIDHQITFKAVMTAFRPLQGEVAREIYSFEVPSSTEWNIPSASTYFMPNYYVDISKTLKIKVRAMKEYRSEIREYPHPRSLKSIEVVARRWGTQIGCDAVEAFEVVRMIR